jgi:hypothetical protein
MPGNLARPQRLRTTRPRRAMRHAGVVGGRALPCPRPVWRRAAPVALFAVVVAAVALAAAERRAPVHRRHGQLDGEAPACY